MSEIDTEEELYVGWTMSTKLTRIVGNLLIPTNLNIRADVSPNEDASELELNKAFQKIRYWFDNVASHSVAFAHDNATAIAMLIDETGKNRTSNILMITPGDPTDEVLAALFQSKMTALARGVVDFNLIEVKSDNSVGLSFTFVGQGENVLPSMEEWIAGERTYFDKPWWSRNDASSLDIVAPADADLSETPSWAYSLDDVGPRKETGVVIRPEFKPTIIDGGKKDE